MWKQLFLVRFRKFDLFLYRWPHLAEGYFAMFGICPVLFLSVCQCLPQILLHHSHHFGKEKYVHNFADNIFKYFSLN